VVYQVVSWVTAAAAKMAEGLKPEQKQRLTLSVGAVATKATVLPQVESSPQKASFAENFLVQDREVQLVEQQQSPREFQRDQAAKR
jgi:hypothetical protein